jgi:hypothetical protein
MNAAAMAIWLSVKISGENSKWRKYQCSMKAMAIMK